jgi:HIV Tat-specific factor 1
MFSDEDDVDLEKVKAKKDEEDEDEDMEDEDNEDEEDMEDEDDEDDEDEDEDMEDEDDEDEDEDMEDEDNEDEDEGDMKEKPKFLKGGQKKLDVDGDGKITGKDFKILRKKSDKKKKKKKKNESTDSIEVSAEKEWMGSIIGQMGNPTVKHFSGLSDEPGPGEVGFAPNSRISDNFTSYEELFESKKSKKEDSDDDSDEEKDSDSDDSSDDSDDMKSMAEKCMKECFGKKPNASFKDCKDHLKKNKETSKYKLSLKEYLVCKKKYSKKKSK